MQLAAVVSHLACINNPQENPKNPLRIGSQIRAIRGEESLFADVPVCSVFATPKPRVNLKLRYINRLADALDHERVLFVQQAGKKGRNTAVL